MENKGLLVGCGGLVTLGFIFIIAAVILVAKFLPELRDLPASPDDADMRIEIETVADAENAWLYYIQACNAVRFTGEQWETLQEIKESENQNKAFFSTILAQNKKAFEIYKQALEAPKAQYFDFFNEEAEIQYDSDNNKVFKEFLSLSWDQSCYEGKSEEALDSIMAYLKLMDRLSKNHQSSLGISIAHSGTEFALDYIFSHINQQAQDKMALKNCISAIGKLYAEKETYQNALKIGYMSLSNGMNEALSSTESNNSSKNNYPFNFMKSFFFHPNRTREAGYVHAKDLLGFIGKPLCEIQESLEHVEDFLDTDNEGPLKTRNALGKIILPMYLPGKTLAHEFCKHNTLVSAVQILLTLKWYQIDHGSIPATLDTLVPAYLETVPLDWYDGQPIKFNLDKKLIYCVGQDLIDNGGSVPKAAGSRWKQKDPGWIVNF